MFVDSRPALPTVETRRHLGHTGQMVLRVVAVAVVVPALVGGCFELERSEGLRPGDARVVVVDESGAVVVGARVSAVGHDRVGISGDDGVAVVGPLPFGEYLLRVEVDANNDGVIDAGATTTTPTVIAKPLLGALPRLSFFDHDKVVVSVAGSIGGTVECPVGSLCRVVAFRTVAGTTLPAEANAAVDATGRWQLDGVVAGEVRVAAFSWTPSVSLEPAQQLFAATRPDAVGVATATVGDDNVVIALASAPASVSAGISIRVAPAEGVTSDADTIEATGVALYVVPSTNGSAPASATTPRADIPGEAVEMPVGLFDIVVNVDDLGGRLFGIVGVPGLTDPLPPISIASFDCVEIADGVDCNDDGLNDMRDLDGNGRIDLADVDINNNGIVDSDDEDVDGDGIADVDEPSECRLVGRGGDRDGDCLCDAVDPLPDCQSNDPLACTLPTPPTCS